MRRLPYAILLVALVLIGCKRTPSYVISPSDMADLLADMHIAEGVVDLNQATYGSDSMRKVLKQSVFEKHGVTQHDFDTSLVWYGHHLDVYIDVYETVIKRLEKRNKELGASIVESSVTMSGDSVDVWPGLKYAALSSRMPSRFVSFDIAKDDNWEPGDVYTWRLKLIDNDNQTVHWTVFAEYEDNSTDWLTTSTSNSDWNEVVYVCDSTKTPTKIRGYFEVRNNQYGDSDKRGKKGKTAVYVDSISLIRKRLDTDSYRFRYRLRNNAPLK